MILGLGTDIIEISRIKKALENPKFITRIYTHEEVQLIEKKGNKWASYAGRFAAKEAVSKALGSGIRDFNFNDIEILSDPLGKPYVIFKNNLKNKFSKQRVELSISHCKEYAMATAIIMEE